MVRIKDVAEMAGVSPTTVSNVIHGNTKKVSEETVRKIQKLLEESGYVPSMGALMLASSNSRIIGVLIGGGHGSVEQQAFTNILIRALELEIYRRNYYMLLHFSDSTDENLQFAAAWKVEGLITIGISAKENQKLQAKSSMPVVSIDVYYEEGQPVPNVGLDDYGGGYLMGSFLLERGHRNIRFLADNDTGVDHQRWLGLQQVCMKGGVLLTEEAHIRIPSDAVRRKKYYKENLAKYAFSSDVLFFASDYYAMEAAGYLDDLGIRVPDDVSIAGFDDNECALLSRPHLTTVHQDPNAKAVTAVEKLFSFIQGSPFIEMETKLPVKLVVRNSVDKPVSL